MLSSCDAEGSTAPSSVTASTATPTSITTPENEPGTIPTTYGPDVDPERLPAEALTPVDATVDGQWFAFTGDGVVVVVAWSVPGDDVTRLARGFAVWRRASSAPHWRRAFVETSGRRGLSELRITTADVTGDGSDDVVAFEGAPGGGTGGCGTWLVVRLPRFDRIYRRSLCDGAIQPGPTGRPGLVLTESIYRSGDAHCCPSAIRTTALVWTGSDWRVGDRTVTST